MHPLSEMTDDIDSGNFFMKEKPSGRKDKNFAELAN